MLTLVLPGTEVAMDMLCQLPLKFYVGVNLGGRLVTGNMYTYRHQVNSYKNQYVFKGHMCKRLVPCFCLHTRRFNIPVTNRFQADLSIFLIILSIYKQFQTFNTLISSLKLEFSRKHIQNVKNRLLCFNT